MKKKKFMLAAVALAGVLFLGVILTFGNLLSGKEDVQKSTGSQQDVNNNVATAVEETPDDQETESTETAVDKETSADIICPFTGLPVGSGAGGMGRYFAGAMHNTIAEELGMTAEELRAERLAGKSIAEIAQERGIDFEGLKAVVIEARTGLLEELVKDGIVTEEQKNYMEQNMKSRMETMMERNNVGPINGQGLRMRQSNGNCPMWDGDFDNQQFRQGGKGLGNGRFAN